MAFDYLTFVATSLYGLLFLVSLLTSFVYIYVFGYNRNRMIFATFILLCGVTLEFGIIFFVKFMSLINYADLIHPYRNLIYIPARTCIFIALLFFLKESIIPFDKN